MPVKTKRKSRKSMTSKSIKSRSKSIKSRSKSMKSKPMKLWSNSMKSWSKSMRSYRKYRGGCDSCKTAGSAGSGASSTGNIWTSSGAMHGGASPEQLSNDTLSHTTDKVFYSAA